MTIPCKSERSVLSHDEYAVVLKSHHPLIYDTGTEELKEARRRLREMRDRERTLARAKRREARGKQKGRGASFRARKSIRPDASRCSPVRSSV